MNAGGINPGRRWWVGFRLRDYHHRSLSRGQKLSRRATEERGCKILSDSSPRVLASQPWFLFRIEPDFHLLSQTGLECSARPEFLSSRHCAAGFGGCSARSLRFCSISFWEGGNLSNPLEICPNTFGQIVSLSVIFWSRNRRHARSFRFKSIRSM